MGNRATPPRSFNTIRQTQYKKRAQREMHRRILLLAICAVLILIFLAISVLLVCSLVETIGSSISNDSESPNEDFGNHSNNPIEYISATKYKDDIHYGPLILVNTLNNGDHEYQFPTKGENTLVVISEYRIDDELYTVSDPVSKKMQVEAVNAFNEMISKYVELSGIKRAVNISDAYRSYSQQGKNKGFSDHHTGYCFALDMEDDAAEWIYENCHKYGFIQRYPQNKKEETGVIEDYTECFRYVGVAHATYITENHLCLEEYIDMLQTEHRYKTDKHLTIQGGDGNQYMVYYVPASGDKVTTLYIPENYSYTISGDNTDDKNNDSDNVGGFIVTVNLSDPLD